MSNAPFMCKYAEHFLGTSEVINGWRVRTIHVYLWILPDFTKALGSSTFFYSCQIVIIKNCTVRWRPLRILINHELLTTFEGDSGGN